MAENLKDLSKATATINGRQYNLVSEKPQNILDEVVEYTNKCIDDVKKRDWAKNMDTSVVSTVVSLNIAEDYITLKREYSELKNQYDKIRTDMFRHNNDMRAAQQLAENLKRENANLKAQIKSDKPAYDANPKKG